MPRNVILRLGEDLTILSSTADLELEFPTFDSISSTDLDGSGNALAGLNGGTLIINSHGSPTTVNGRSSADLAELLARNGLSGPVDIVLLACNTGLLGAPYALELKVCLVQSHKIMCSVSAPRGTVGTNLLGQWKVKLPSGGSIPLGEKGSTFETTKPF